MINDRRLHNASRWLRTTQRVLILTALIMIATNGTSAAPTQTPDPRAIDRFVTTQMVANRIPGLALAITRGDDVLYVQGYGTSGAGSQITPQTQFLTASLSKSFTAMAVLQLVEAGEIELDQPVQRYLPEFTLADPNVARQITVRQLLNQTSGLADTGFAAGLNQEQPTLAVRVASLRSARPVAAPGAEFHYFDPNYQILARLVEAVSGQPFDNYLQTHIFAPLEMRDTFSAVTADEARERATQLALGHIVVYGFPVALPELAGFLGGSGGVVSTAEDMAHYLVMQGNGGRYEGRSLLSPQSLALMHTPAPGLSGNYGMGWLIGETQGVRTIEHNGVLSTFYAEAVMLPESGYSFVLLYNESALTAATLAFPRMKQGLVALLTSQAPPDGGLTVPALGGILAALTALGTGLALRSLLRLTRWTKEHATTPRWRLAPGILGALAPGLILLWLPQLLAQGSGRYFNHVMLARAMPGVVIWLALCGGLGLVNAVTRLVILTRNVRNR